MSVQGLWSVSDGCECGKRGGGCISGDDSRPAWLIGYRVSVWGGGYIVA